MTDLHMNPSLLPSERERYASLANDERWLAGYDAGKDSGEEAADKEIADLEDSLTRANDDADDANREVEALRSLIEALGAFREALPVDVAVALESVAAGSDAAAAKLVIQQALEEMTSAS